VAREAAGYNEHGIDPNGIAAAGIAGGEPLGRYRNTAQSIFIERPCCCIGIAALLYLDEGNRPATTSNQINFAAGHACSMGEDAPSLQAQPPSGEQLRPAATRFC